MTPPAPLAAIRGIRALVSLGLTSSAAAMLIPQAAGVLAWIGVGSMLTAACVRLPLAVARWREVEDRRFVLAAGALLLVMVFGAVVGQLAGT